MKKLLVLLLPSFLALHAHSQGSATPKAPRNTLSLGAYSFNLEQSGPSLGYERKVVNDHLVAGIDAVYYNDPLIQWEFPLHLNYLIFPGANHIEAGASYVSLLTYRQVNMYALNLGYRYESLKKKGLMARLGISPGSSTESYIRGGLHESFAMRMYIAAGYSF